MTKCIYIDKEHADIVRQLGNKNQVIQKIFVEMVKHPLWFDYAKAYPVPPADGRSYRLVVDIDPRVVEYLGEVPMRNMVYWFIDNEKYDEFEWGKVEKKYPKKTKRLLNNYKKALDSVAILCKMEPQTWKEVLDYIIAHEPEVKEE